MSKFGAVHQYIHRRAKQGFWKLVDGFIPHAGNNYQPQALAHRALIGYSLVLVALKLVVLLAPLALPSSSLYSSAITTQNIFNLTNQARVNLSLSELKYNSVLEKAAQQKAEDMLAKQYFAHTSPQGITPWSWFEKAGYKYRHAGENLAVHFYEAEDVQAAWLASPTHRANIVSDKYSEIGVGVATGNFEGSNATFVVQMFGTPRPSTTATEIAPTFTPSKTSSQVRIVPKTQQAIKVSIKRDQPTQAATAQLAGEQISLTEVSPGVWEGDFTMDNKVTQENGEPLSAVFEESDKTVLENLGYVASGGNTQKLYIFNEGVDSFVTLFGRLKIGNLDDKVKAFYLGFMLFLGAGIISYIIILKMTILKPSVLTHALTVLGLALLLLLV